MSDAIKHECAVGLIRLRKPVEFYREKYETANYGFGKLALLLEKQHNRGQDGAGICTVRLNPSPGEPAYKLVKSNSSHPLAEVLERENEFFSGELLLGHLRYATFGRHDINACYPFVRDNSCLNRTLMFAGNFNLTDPRGIFDLLLKSGHHPASVSDGYLMLQLIGHYYEKVLNANPGTQNGDLFPEVLRQVEKHLDGAYTICCMTADGNAFVLRDPAGIRPGYYFINDEVAVVASERPAIQAAFNCSADEVQEIPRGKMLLLGRDSSVRFCDCLEPKERRSCVFERIYFSRANDSDIHRERRALGRMLTSAILEAANHDFDRAFFSYIPNSAQIAFHGMLETLFRIASSERKNVRFGQIAVKDAKFRTFIADAAERKDFYMHIYDVTYGLTSPGDTLVVLDDSIVRGNTIRKAVLPIFDRLNVRKIVIASSAPPIKYPDCYGIDMASLKELVAFNAAVSLLRKKGRESVLAECYHKAKECLENPVHPMINCVRPVYDEFTDEELTGEIARLLIPDGLRAEFQVVFQPCANLAVCCPNHRGDWYFTGDYPTPGGFRVVNQALVNYMQNIEERAYSL